MRASVRRQVHEMVKAIRVARIDKTVSPGCWTPIAQEMAYMSELVHIFTVRHKLYNRGIN